MLPISNLLQAILGPRKQGDGPGLLQRLASIELGTPQMSDERRAIMERAGQPVRTEPYTLGELAGAPWGLRDAMIGGSPGDIATKLVGEKQDGGEGIPIALASTLSAPRVHPSLHGVVELAVDSATDPLNAVGAGAVASKGRQIRGIRAANKASEVMRAAGAMPEEIARLTKIMDESGNPRRMYHGTPHYGFSVRDMSLDHSGKTTGNDGWFGRGLYFTPDEEVAASYSKMRYDPTGKSLFGKEQGEGRVLDAFIDSRQPFETAFHRVKDDMRRSGVSATVDKYGVLENPVGVTDELRRKGFDSVYASDAAELSVFDPSQVYLPYIAPAIKNEPSLSPLLTSIFGYNAAKQAGDR